MANATQDTAPAFAPVPIIDPDAFERFEGLRETTLALFTDAKVNSTLRAFVDFVYTIALEYSRYWPNEPGGSFRHECRAAVADLRHLQGYLAMLNQQRIDASLEEEEGRLSRICGRLSPRVKKIADALEKEMDAWQAEGEA